MKVGSDAGSRDRARSAQVELHVHSTASDGTKTPTEVADAVAERGLAGFALTDHDTVEGLDEAREAARERGLRFLTGAELSANEPGRSVHVLAYGFDHDDPDFRDFLSDWRETRLRRAERIVEKLRREGVPLTLDDVRQESSGGVLTRAHVGRALVNGGLAPNQSAAFDRWLSRGRPCFVEKPPLRPEEVFRRTHAAGGVAVVAHPGRDDSEGEIRRWVSEGADGVEIRHPGNPPALRKRLEALTEELDLLRTGGSDWHGPEQAKPDLGSENVPLAWMEAIEERAARARASASRGSGGAKGPDGDGQHEVRRQQEERAAGR